MVGYNNYGYSEGKIYGCSKVKVWFEHWLMIKFGEGLGKG